jgi:4-methyl-5(b-hydroxyethyl)-thiazole monophosphate biosynthesis
MARVLVPLAEGFEEIEAVTIIDVLRRADVAVTVAALATSPVLGAHDITLGADTTLEAAGTVTYDAVILPGGGKGSQLLREDRRVLDLLRRHAELGKVTAAICAAPTALEAAGLLENRRATSYPGNGLPSAQYSEERVVEDGNIITSRSAGTALEFALVLVGRLVGESARAALEASLLVRVSREP